MPEQLSTERYSAVVELQLLAQGKSYPLAQIGPDFVIFKTRVDLQRCDATIIMHVDGKERRWPVSLVDGATRDSDVVKIETREPSPAA